MPLTTGFFIVLIRHSMREQAQWHCRTAPAAFNYGFGIVDCNRMNTGRFHPPFHFPGYYRPDERKPGSPHAKMGKPDRSQYPARSVLFNFYHDNNEKKMRPLLHHAQTYANRWNAVIWPEMPKGTSIHPIHVRPQILRGRN
jgi:hypothetical protein